MHPDNIKKTLRYILVFLINSTLLVEVRLHCDLQQDGSIGRFPLAKQTLDYNYAMIIARDVQVINLLHSPLYLLPGISLALTGNGEPCRYVASRELWRQPAQDLISIFWNNMQEKKKKKRGRRSPTATNRCGGFLNQEAWITYLIPA